MFYYDDSRVNFDGPIIYTKCSKTDIYTLPTADMFIKIDKAFCICVTPLQNGNKTAVATGPLVHDFARDAVLIGREVIGLEGLGKSVEADHWNKVRDATCSHPSSFCPPSSYTAPHTALSFALRQGPHHFWVSVATNRFVRGWQPWNGLNVYDPDTWNVGPSSH